MSDTPETVAPDERVATLNALVAVREHLACDEDCTGDHWATWLAIEAHVASLQAELTELRAERDEARQALLWWWDDPDNPPVAAARIVRALRSPENPEDRDRG